MRVLPVGRIHNALGLLPLLLLLGLAGVAFCAGTPTKLAFGQQPTNAVAGAIITPAVTVRILDSRNRLCTTATNAVTIAIYTNPGGGTLSGTLTKNAVGGIATFNNLSINKTGTGYRLRATATGLTGVTSNTFNITPGAAAKLAYNQQPSSAVAGAAISPAVTVRVLDALDNLVTTATNAVTMAIDTNPGGGMLSGTLTRNAVSGTATFSGLSINKTGTGYKLRATATGLTQAISNTFNITPGAPAQLVFGQQPSNAAPGATITPAVTVNLLDAQGNQTTGTNAVGMAIANNPGGGTLSGTLSKNAVNGIATFSDLSIDAGGNGYTLRATATGLTQATSNAFDITVVGTPLSIGGVVQCPILMVGGTGNPANPSALELQRWLNQVTGGSFAIQAYSAGATGIILGTIAEFPTQAALYNVTAETVGAEGYRIVADGASVWILAANTLGVDHGVYRLLESMGCRWLVPESTDTAWTIIPSTPTLTSTLNVTEKPAYEWVRIWYTFGGQPGDVTTWHKRNNMPRAFYGVVGHMWDSVLSASEFAAHPEWGALVGGVRTNAQLCISNVGLQEHFIQQHVLAAFAADPTRTSVSVSPADGGGFCECPNCQAIGNGTPSDQAYFMANLCARAVSLTYPGQDKWVNIYAYSYTATPPSYPLTGPCPTWIWPSPPITFTQFEPNVYAQFTTWYNYSGMSLYDQIAAFRAQGLQKAGTYEYLAYLDQDKPEAEASFYYALANKMKTYTNTFNVASMDCQSACNWAPNGMGYWLMSRMAWDPNQSVDALVQDYCDKAYGNASVPMRRYHDRMANGIRYNVLFIRDSLEDLKEAYSLEGRPEYVARLDRVAMYLHDMRLMYEHKIARETQQPSTVLNEIDHRWVNWIRRIWDTQMIDSKIDLYDWPISGQMFSPNDPSANVPAEMAVWKTERTDLPTSAEMIGVFNDDYTYFFGTPDIEPILKPFSLHLVPINDVRPDLVTAWAGMTEQLAGMEDSHYYFRGLGGEAVTITVTPLGGHNMDGRHWRLNQVNEDTGAETTIMDAVYTSGGNPLAVNATLPAAGLYVFHPDTYYWSAATVTFSPARANNLLATQWAFTQWYGLPKAFFYVPKGTEGFSISFVQNGGNMGQPITLTTADGTTVYTHPAILQNELPTLVVTVPPGKDDQIWRINAQSLRLSFYLSGVPPYIAFAPGKLLVPQETVRVTASPLTVNTSENTPVNGTLTATSAYSLPLTYSLLTGSAEQVTALSTAKGALVITNTSTGAFTYTPAGNAWGTDLFNFIASDGVCASMPATLTVNINSVPQAPAPTANNTSLTTSAGLAARGQFSATDPTNDALTFTITQNGAKGTASLVDASTGTFIYTPNIGETGQDTVLFTVNDGYGTSNTGTVTITINP